MRQALAGLSGILPMRHPMLFQVSQVLVAVSPALTSLSWSLSPMH
jgi:hypothetical protein